MHRSLLCCWCFRPSGRHPHNKTSPASPPSSTATPSKSTASEFVCLASTPQKAANCACAPMANAGVAGSNQALRWRIGSERATVRCEPRDIDRYRRIVAVCLKGTEDLNRWMVAKGWAVAYPRYSLDYVTDEDAARRKRINMWSGDFKMPLGLARAAPKLLMRRST